MCICDMHGRAGFHCRQCCSTFGSITGFDRHIVRGIHAAPLDRGLVQDSRGVWRKPNPGHLGRQTSGV